MNAISWTLQKILHGLRIVTMALFGGASMTAFLLLAIVVGVGLSKPALELDFPIVTVIASLYMAGACCFLLFLLFSFSAKIYKGIQQNVPGNSLMNYGPLLFLGEGLIDGATIMALIAFLLERQWAVLGVAAIGIAVLMRRYPTREKFEAFQERFTAIETERRYKGFDRKIRGITSEIYRRRI